MSTLEVHGGAEVHSGTEVHGGAVDAMRIRFPGAPEPWVDLSTGINPWPWPAGSGLLQGLNRLPTRTEHKRCANAMAAAFGAPEDSVVVAPGSELLIRLLPSVIKPQRVAILSPSYGDHARTWRGAGCEVIETPDPLTQAGAADAVVVCNPNNPDGRRFDPSSLAAARRRLRARGGWLIVDEAFADLDPGLSMAPQAGEENLLVLRSMGKFYGLPGMRLGALLAPGPIRRLMTERLGWWGVSSPALAAGAAAYSDRTWQRETRRRLTAARERLDRLLAERACDVIGGTDLFRYVKVPDAEQCWRRLAELGLYVRRFPWTSRHLRIGLPADADAESRLLDALGYLTVTGRPATMSSTR